MTDDVPESASLTRLRNAWLDSTSAVEGETCLAPAWVWDAVSGTHAPEELDRGLAHVARCGACAEAWRVAHEMVVGDAHAERRATRDRGRAAWHSWRVWAPAAAAVVVLIGGMGYDRGWFEPRSPESADRVVRGTGASLASALGDAAACERAACRLAWSDAGPGARYTVRVTRGDLEPLTSAGGLLQREYLVPANVLDTVAPGGEVFWQVDAVLPDGKRLSSPAFVLQVR